MKIEIKDCLNARVIWSGDAESVKAALALALECGADLSGACLYGADLYWADLSGANLSRANLSRACLYGTNLSGANLSMADLSGADLSRVCLSRACLYGADLSRANLSRANLLGSNLYGSNLSGADLSGADLSGANLSGANLSGANLYGANLSGSNLSGADLSRACLSGADLSRATGAELAIAATRILPAGCLRVWKMCYGGVIAELEVPAEAKRSHALGRKCRAEYVRTISLTSGMKEVQSMRGDGTKYVVGEITRCDKWDDDWTKECSGGIHFFITREEAEALV